MSSRVSTAGMHDAAILQILAQQSKLSYTQSQVASGKRVLSPADDPVATTQIIDLTRARAQMEQYGKNTVAATNRLQTAESALADVGSLLQRVRELTLQAGNVTNDTTALASIRTELRARVEELQGIANRRDASGDYLFSGYSAQVTPFSRGPTGVSYAGDQGVRQLQIGPDQTVAVSFPGQRVFLDIPEGNGTFTTATGVHTGAGSIDTGQIVNAAAWVPGNYTLRFNTPGSWDVVDSTNAVIASGAYQAGSAINFNGAQVVVSGAPAAGDTFVIAPASKQDMFSTLDDLGNALSANLQDPAERSQLYTNLSAALLQIDQGLTNVLDLRADVGARLSMIDAATESRENLDVNLQKSLSEMQDLDYAEAISRMNQQMVALQAAQAAYTRLGQMSLFDYL
ncbi:MAG: flagellar hook-associated protein FlgL [Gammaproteobacteria bacterium]|nr:flagellar hook-associated protein FlgL [Gammaproteobacteria bacterium]